MISEWVLLLRLLWKISNFLYIFLYFDVILTEIHFVCCAFTSVISLSHCVIVYVTSIFSGSYFFFNFFSFILMLAIMGFDTMLRMQWGMLLLIYFLVLIIKCSCEIVSNRSRLTIFLLFIPSTPILPSINFRVFLYKNFNIN